MCVPFCTHRNQLLSLGIRVCPSRNVSYYDEPNYGRASSNLPLITNPSWESITGQSRLTPPLISDDTVSPSRSLALLFAISSLTSFRALVESMATSYQKGRMYFNQTVEELEAEKCATGGIFSALTSKLMLFNHMFILFVIVASFVATTFAFRMLWKHNVFPNCARSILWSALVNGLIHQWTMAVIRIRALSQSIAHSTDACSIQFHSSQCFFDNYAYYVTNIFSSCCLLSLFLDRLQSFRLRSCYNSSQFICSVVFFVYQFICAWSVVLWVFHDIQFVGYVPMCFYPPQHSLTKFYFITEIRFYALIVLFFASLIILFLNRKREKMMIHNVFDTESRYKSYENLMTTRAVCLIIFTQIACLGSTSLGTSLLHKLELQMPDYLFHSLVAFMAGLTYSNFFLPIVIYHQTSRIIAHRYKAIESLQNQKAEKFSEHFGSLDEAWGRVEIRNSKIVY